MRPPASDNRSHPQRQSGGRPRFPGRTPNRIDAGIVEAIDVALTYDDGATFQRTDTFRVLPTSEPQFWLLRLTRPTQRVWQASFTHHLKNGAQRTLAQSLPTRRSCQSTIPSRGHSTSGPSRCSSRVPCNASSSMCSTSMRATATAARHALKSQVAPPSR